MNGNILKGLRQPHSAVTPKAVFKHHINPSLPFIANLSCTHRQIDVLKLNRLKLHTSPRNHSELIHFHSYFNEDNKLSVSEYSCKFLN